MNNSAPEHQRNPKRKMRNWLVEWLGPRIPEEWELQDRTLSCETNAIKRLRSTLSEIDEVFLTAFRRSLGAGIPERGETWLATYLTISRRDNEDFERSIAAEKMPAEGRNLSFLQDQDKMRYWRMAIDFLILENDGFPGRMIFEGGRYTACPVPQVHASGFSSRVLEVEKLASHLPREVIAAVTSTSRVPEQGDILRHIRTRIDLLDSLLESTFSARVMGQRLVSLATEIERTWPNEVPRHEAFLTSGRVVHAYPQSRGSSIPTPKIVMIITISSVTSGSLAVLSYLKATQQVGTPQDADFFSLIQNSLIQISSIWVMMLTLQKTCLKNHGWIYIWFLVAFGSLSVAVAVPVYLVAPTGWSTLLSAASGISQSLVTLQLVYSLAV